MYTNIIKIILFQKKTKKIFCLVIIFKKKSFEIAVVVGFWFNTIRIINTLFKIIIVSMLGNILILK